MADLKPTFIDPNNPSQLREPRAGDNFINEPDVSFDNISDLTDYKIDQSPRTKTANVMGYYSAGDGGGGTFYWDSSEDKSNHNGGTVINPDHLSTIGSTNWYSATGDSTDTTGSGCWKRKNIYFAQPEMYGAKGDGQTKDTEAFQKMLAEHSHIYLTQHYLLDAISAERNKYRIIGNREAKLDFSNVTDESNSDYADLLIQGSREVLPDLSSNVSKDDTSVSFVSNHGLSAGDIFYIYNDTDFSFSPHRNYYHAGEICRVKEVVSSTVVELHKPLYADYSSADVDVYKFNSIDLTMRDFDIIGDDRYGTWIGYGENVEVRNINYKGIFQQTLTLGMCYGGVVENINVTHTGNASNYDYAIKYGSAQNIKIKDCVVDSLGDSVESGASAQQVHKIPSRNITVDNVTGSRSLSAHGDVEHVKFINSEAESILMAGDYCEARNNEVRQHISVREDIGCNFKIINNKIHDTEPSGSTYGDHRRIACDMASESLTRGGDFIIRDNEIEGLVRVDCISNHGKKYNLIVKNNTITPYKNQEDGELRINRLGGKYNRVVVEDNTIRGVYDGNYYPGNALYLSDLNCNHLSVKNNTVYGRARIQWDAIDSFINVWVEDNNWIKLPLAATVFGSTSVGSNLFFINNKVLDNKRSDGPSSLTRTNVFFNGITNLFLEDNKMGDSEIDNPDGNWIGIQEGVSNVYAKNNSSLQQQSKDIRYGGNFSSDRLKRSNTGYANKKSGVATIPSGNNHIEVDFGRIEPNYSIQLTGTHEEVSGCVVVNKDGVGFEIRTSDTSPVSGDREVYWTISY